MMMLERGSMGMSKVCSIGNKCDVNETELLEYLVNDPNTEVIACYLESIIDGRKFMELARSSDKPVIVLKAGRSDSGAKAAMSHTASLSGSSAIYSGAFRQAGIIQVYDMHELMDMARGFSMTDSYRPGGRTAVMTFSGGAGIVTADLLEDRGLMLADLSQETMAALKALIPGMDGTVASGRPLARGRTKRGHQSLHRRGGSDHERPGSRLPSSGNIRMGIRQTGLPCPDR